MRRLDVMIVISDGSARDWVEQNASLGVFAHSLFGGGEAAMSVFETLRVGEWMEASTPGAAPWLDPLGGARFPLLLFSASWSIDFSPSCLVCSRACFVESLTGMCRSLLCWVFRKRGVCFEVLRVHCLAFKGCRAHKVSWVDMKVPMCSDT